MLLLGQTKILHATCSMHCELDLLLKPRVVAVHLADWFLKQRCWLHPDRG